MDILSVVFAKMEGPQLDSGALVMLGIGALIIWAIMHYVLSDKYSESIIVFVDSVRSSSPATPEYPEKTKTEDNEALRKKKARQRRREFASRAIVTAKRAASMARDCLWMVAVSAAIILTTVLLVYTR